MYPYRPQVAALANRFNPQNTDGAPIMRQAPMPTSGQIQPSGLQPQIAALARQYNPQFNPMFGAQMPQPQPGFQQQMQNMQQSLAQYQLANPMQQPGDMQSQYANLANQMPTWQNGTAFNMGWANPQPPSGVTPNGVNQLNALTGGAYSAQPQTNTMMPGQQPTVNTAGLPGQMTAGGPQPMRQFVPGGMGPSGMAPGLGGGVNGLARYYTR